ncbi:MAG: hypothetical protein JWM33_1353 [Caulobacteraceae bacterium]|nr:hypothetical protein [Caulobacteraceae bacterium]
MAARTRPLALFLLLVAGCAAKPSGVISTDTAAEDRLLATALADQYDFRRLDADDAAALAASARVRRRGEDLILDLTGGGTLTLAGNEKVCDADNDFDACAVYRLMGDLPSRRAILVDKGLYEGNQILLIDDRTGRQTPLPAAPIFSPDNQRLLIQGQDDGYGGPDNLEIWRRTGDGWSAEWEHPVKQVYQEVPGLQMPYVVTVSDWRGDVIDLALSTRPTEPVQRRWTGRLRFSNGQWILTQDAPNS